MKYKIFFLLLLGIFGLLSCSGNENYKNNSSKDNFAKYKPVAYSIEEEKDISIRAISGKLSDYTLSELANLPKNKRMIYQVVVTPDIKSEQVKPTLEKVISDIIASDNDIDEITVYLYSDKQIIQQSYDIAMAEWTYLGIWGKITPEIAKNNNRTNYKINITLKENLDQYLKQRDKKETLFGLAEETRRAFFKELNNAETRALTEADQLYPPKYEENYYKNIDKNDELTKKYHAEVRAKYNISKELQWKIVDEGVKENWPME